MFRSKPLVFSLLFALTFLIASTAADASANGVSLPAHRRAAQASRMVKVRSPQILPGGGGNGVVSGFGEDPNQEKPAPGSSSTTSTTSSSSSTTTSSTSSTTATSTTSSSTSTTSTTSSTSSTTTSSTSSSSSSTTSTSSSSSSSRPAETSAPASQTTQASANKPTNNVNDNVTLTVTSTSSSASSTSTSSADAKAASSSSSSITKTTLTVIIVIASVVGGAFLIWTIIRKWKFRPSSEFEDRMQPIDWQPSVDNDDGAIPGHRRRGSGASHGSFHSSNDHAYGMGASNTSGSGGLVADLPPHDFTAGATNLAPMGGYADMARGPSPQPAMQELARGPSMNRGYPAYPQSAYDNYGPRY